MNEQIFSEVDKKKKKQYFRYLTYFCQFCCCFKRTFILRWHGTVSTQLKSVQGITHLVMRLKQIAYNFLAQSMFLKPLSQYETQPEFRT